MLRREFGGVMEEKNIYKRIQNHPIVQEISYDDSMSREELDLEYAQRMREALDEIISDLKEKIKDNKWRNEPFDSY